ncbi:MAG: hypothetical protein M3431_08625, partial [Actinomycetota bacterium]|nr:hypothetical protein [Actinomycetota bacterium]
MGYEDEDYFAYRWWAVDEIGGSSERFNPGRLPDLISAHLRGETIDEPYEAGPRTLDPPMTASDDHPTISDADIEAVLAEAEGARGVGSRWGNANAMVEPSRETMRWRHPGA